MKKKKNKMHSVHEERDVKVSVKEENKPSKINNKGEKRFGIVMSSGTEERIAAEVKKLKYLKATRSEVIELMLEMTLEHQGDSNRLSEELERRLIAKRKSI
jgi:hypothetical protein